MDEGYVKLKNNDVRFKNRKFLNIDNEIETMLEPQDITRGAVVSVMCSPHFYEYSRRNKDEEGKGKSSNVEETKGKKIGGTSFEPDGYSLRIDHITLIKRADVGNDFTSPRKRKRLYPNFIIQHYLTECKRKTLHHSPFL
jgi:hypothetical protein